MRSLDKYEKAKSEERRREREGQTSDREIRESTFKRKRGLGGDLVIAIIRESDVYIRTDLYKAAFFPRCAYCGNRERIIEQGEARGKREF